MEKIGIEKISNGYIVYGVDYKTYRETLALAEKEFQVEGQNVVKSLKQEELEKFSEKK